MAFITEDRVQETSTTTGTGSFTLAGAVAGFRAFSAVCSTNDLFPYTIEAVDGSGIPTGEWETGIGTYSGANTLARTTVLESSNAGAAVNFSAGTKRAFINVLGYSLQPKLIGSQATTSGTSVSFTSIPQYFDTLRVGITGVSHDSGSSQHLQMELSGDNGSTWTGVIQLTQTAGTTSAAYYGQWDIPAYTDNRGFCHGSVGSTSGDVSITGQIRGTAWRIAGGIDAIRISPAGGSNFDAGSVELMGVC